MRLMYFGVCVNGVVCSASEFFFPLQVCPAEQHALYELDKANMTLSSYCVIA